jgi:hypothetical protein
MSEAKKKEHPFKNILRAYSITNVMLAVHLKVGKQRISNMLNGQSMMPMRAEWKLQKLVDRLHNPVFEITGTRTVDTLP